MYAKLVREGATPADLISATEAYAKTRKGEAEQYTMHAATFFGANDRWRDFLPEPVPEVDKVSARVYDQWDELACYTDPRTGAPVDQNPSIAGYIRPSGPGNTFLGADNTPYVLDAQGRRQRPDYWN